jgi:septum formation inhibitor-activating ATPase MinD
VSKEGITEDEILGEISDSKRIIGNIDDKGRTLQEKNSDLYAKLNEKILSKPSMLSASSVRLYKPPPLLAFQEDPDTVTIRTDQTAGSHTPSPTGD